MRLCGKGSVSPGRVHTTIKNKCMLAICTKQSYWFTSEAVYQKEISRDCSKIIVQVSERRV